MSSNNKKEIENNKEKIKKQNKEHYYIEIEEKNNLFQIAKIKLYDYDTLLKYYSNKNILKDREYLEKIIKELNLLVEEDFGNMLLPFLSPPCHDLLNEYINSDLDEEESIKSLEDFKYIKIFEKLKNNIFISKENVSLIYSYFGSLYYDAKEIEQNDKRLSKFLKVKELWKIFYTLPKVEEIKYKSNFSIIGGNLILKLKEEYEFSKLAIYIKINFLSYNYLYTKLENIIFIKINDKIININLKDFNYIKDISFVEFRIYQTQIEILYNDKKNNIPINNNNIEKIKEVTFFKNFYGQISSIELSIIRKSMGTKSKNCIFYPIPNSEENILYGIPKNIKLDMDLKNNLEKINSKNNENKESKEFKENKDLKDESEYLKELNIIDLTMDEEPYELKIDNIKLIKSNYINYNEENYNIIEYFGGITQILPFMRLINNLYENKNIELINNQNKNDLLISFVNDILWTFINIIFHYNEYSINVYKYCLFFFSIIVELDRNLFSKNDIIIEKIYSLNQDIITKHTDLISCFFKILKMDENENINNFFIDILDNNIIFIINNYEYFFNQLYKKLMKELFVFNGNWSKKELFYNIYKDENTISIKYKQINYYTKNFQQPFIYPILEMDKYYPNFTHFEKKNLFKNPNEKYLNYNFCLSDNNIIINLIKYYMSIHENKNDEFEKCCLVKKIYHVKGKIGILKKKDDKEESFEIIFISNDTDVEYTCNKKKKDKIKKSNKEDNYKCYGSIFSCPKKEYGRRIIIKSDEILFILIREYFHRLSAIEIFTIKNKSYYFNFNQKFEIKITNPFKRNIKIENTNNINPEDIEDNINESKNVINNNDNNIENEEKEFNINDEEKDEIKEIENPILLNMKTNNFEKIIKRSTLLGYYNKKYKKYMYPLFNTKYLSSLNSKFYSNFDILMLINLFSNRSLKDLYQYPVFPMIYGLINKKRNMSTHIGLQDIDEQSNERKRLVIETYLSSADDFKANRAADNSLRLFTTHYSNPTYTSNFLIRVLPYSFSCIELQGDGFDNPNRLFYSIDGMMKNSLSQKSDLRELIPEFFYFIELFYNKNNLQLKQLRDKRDIDTLRIISIKETEIEGKITKEDVKEKEKKKEHYKFIADMRYFLEKEEKLNEWIDLIFGKNQKSDEFQRNYYEEESFVKFENKDEILNNNIIMECTDFGLIPFKLFKSKFPIAFKGNIENIKIYNNIMIDYDHFSNYSNPIKSFICIGRTKIDEDYLKFYQNNKKFNNNISNKLKEIDEFCYYFIGDIFGNVTIYQLFNETIQNNEIKTKKRKYSKIKGIISNIKQNYKRVKTMNKDLKNKILENFFKKGDRKEEEEKKDKKEEEEKEEEDEEEEKNKEDNIIKEHYYAKIDRVAQPNIFKISVFNKINAHNKQIKYIDFNGRLNLFVTYALDGYINLYLFPSCKLVNSIKVTNIVGNKCIFDKVLLISNPFPMIFCSNSLIIYIFDINGNFIHLESIADQEMKIFIDKNYGIVQDFLTISGIEYSLPLIDKIQK